MFGSGSVFGSFNPIKKDQAKKKPANNKHEKVHIPKYFSVKHQQDGSFSVSLHAQYQLKKGEKYFQDIQTYAVLANQKKQINAGKIKNKFDLEYYPSFQFALAKANMQEEKCTICLCEFQIKQGQQLEKELFNQNEDDIYMLKCSHKFHLGCLKNLIGDKDWAKCPVCSTIFGIMKGDQPEGTMDVSFDPLRSLPGHGKGLITIQYHMKSSERNGQKFAGTTRVAYLPDNKQGRQVLQLLKQAFKRKLIFTVGRSVTSGRDNQTVWNGIHHKTSTHGGVSSFGYPDETYLDRVKQELAAKGITLESIEYQSQKKSY